MNPLLLYWVARRARLVSPDGAAEYRVSRIHTAIGTAAENHLRLADSTVSRRHATIEKTPTQWRIRDEGSTNGTFVNGVRVEDSAEIHRGDELQLGKTRLYFLGRRDPIPGVSPRISRVGLRRARHPVRILAVTSLLFVTAFAATRYWFDQDSGLEPGASGSSTTAAPGAFATVMTAAPRSSPIPQVLAAISTPSAATPASAPDAGPPPEWLKRVNDYRAMVKLAPVADDPTLSTGELAHVNYLLRNYGGLIRKGQSTGAVMHTEDPGKPGFSPQGMRAASSSDIDEWPGPEAPATSGWAVDDWMTGAFHRLNILNPALHRVAYGESCDSGSCAAALNVLTDADYEMVGLAAPLATPIEFPAPGSVTPLGPLWGEWPDPLTSCPGYTVPVGLPITLQMGAMVQAQLGAFQLTRAGSSGSVEACGFDASTYSNPDAFSQKRGRDVLRDFGAVSIIPRAPLDKDATYIVSITVDGHPYQWSFSTSP